MFGLIMTLFGGIITPLVKAWSSYMVGRMQSNEAGFAAGAAADVAVTQAMLSTEVQNNALKVSVYGTPINRICMWTAGYPVCLHFGLVFVDTILASKAFYGQALIGVPKLPAPYDNFEWLVVSSFFLVHAVHLGTSNVNSWLSKK